MHDIQELFLPTSLTDPEPLKIVVFNAISLKALAIAINIIATTSQEHCNST